MAGVGKFASGEHDRLVEPEPQVATVRAFATRHRGALALAALVVVLAGLLLVSNRTVLTARFGPSHDGFNGSVWASGSRAMRHEGLIESRFGGRSALGEYANHPPGILAETYVAESMAGEHRIVTRSPAWIGSIVAIALLVWLLVDAGFRRWTVAAAVTVVMTSQLFLVYGAMLDTPVTSLPFSLAVLIAAQRVVQNRPPPRWMLVLAAMLAVCSGWQSATMLSFAGVWVFSGVKGDRRRLISGAWFAGGGVVGLTITLLWIRWVYGSFGQLIDQEKLRSNGQGLVASLSRQGTFLTGLIPYAGIIGIVGLVIALTGRSRVRHLALVSTGAVAAYAVYFRQGAYVHDYWNYAVIIPLAVGVAAVAELVVPMIAGARKIEPGLVGAALVGIVVFVSLAKPSGAKMSRDSGVSAASLIGSAIASVPSDSPALGDVGSRSQYSSLLPWVLYETGRRPWILTPKSGRLYVSAEHSDVPMLVALDSLGPELRHRIELVAVDKNGEWALIRAKDAVRLFSPS